MRLIFFPIFILTMIFIFHGLTKNTSRLSPEESEQSSSHQTSIASYSPTKKIEKTKLNLHNSRKVQNAKTFEPQTNQIQEKNRRPQFPSVNGSKSQPPSNGASPAPKVDPSASASRQAPSFDPQDLLLLQQAAQRAQRDGSKVAYIGEVQDLYAFTPHFFETYRDSTGSPAIRIRQVASTDPGLGPQGQNQIQVQREPYPVPSKSNYGFLSRAIMIAADDGATLINIASEDIDRSRLKEAIQYARNRGVAVVTIPPPNR